MAVSIETPLQLACGAVLPNRLIKAAMTEGLADSAGHVGDELVTLYRRWADGGAGTLITGNVMIDGRYLERPGNMIADSDAALPGLRRLAKAGTRNGTQLWMQISHPGRQCTRLVASDPVSASDVQLNLLGNFARPRALTDDEIGATIDAYAAAALRARQAGFTGVQIHAAHGYLLSQFLSPVTNRRDDRWGGSLENRARMLVECTRATRACVGADFTIAVKLNSADFQKGGFSPQDSEHVAVMLEAEGVDLIEISGGTYEQPRLLGGSGDKRTLEEPKAQSTQRREAYFLDYTKRLRAATKLPLAVTGGFRNRQFMNDVLAGDELDAIGIARPLCVEPNAPALLLGGQLNELPTPEHALRLGGGPFAPGSGITAIRALNAQASVGWFYRQIIRLAHDKAPDLSLTTRTALWRHLRDEVRSGIARRRYRRNAAREQIA